MRKKLGILFCALIILTNPSVLYAQTSTSSASLRSNSSTNNTSKRIIRDFKINLNEYSAFGTDCSQKRRGDANCDTQINDFDLSIWEVEFTAANPPKRADFNNDGVVNLLDYGIWRNTTFPPRTTALNQKLNSGLLDSFFSLILNLKSSILNPVLAQESTSGAGEVNSSQSFTSPSGISMVLNSLAGNNSQQINFNQNGNPTSAAFFDSNGESYAEVAFTSSGSTIIATESNGIPVTVSKTASGPIIENFRNTDGSLLALKSWPSQTSYDSGEPPLAVTIPGQGNTREVLNMQPNGDGIIEKLDTAGNILTRTQLRSNGTIVTEDLQNNLTVQSNTEAKFTNLSMQNNIGGQTQYMFYDGTLFAIVQSDGAKNAYISKPLNSSGSSWSFETLVDGVKRAEKTVSDPIIEAKSNTPNPQTLIQYINVYKQSSANPDAVNFSDGFSNSTSSMNQIISKANSILTLSQTQSPSVLGIIKEAKAQQSPNIVGTLPDGTSIVQGTQPTQFEYRSSSGAPTTVDGNLGFNVNISTWTPTQGPLAGQQVSAVEVQYFNPSYQITNSQTIASPEAPSTASFTPSQVARDATGASAPSQPAAPAAPAPPAQPAAPAPAAPAQPAAPQTATCTGSCAVSYSALERYEQYKAQEIAAGRQEQAFNTWATLSAGLNAEQASGAISIRNAHNEFSKDVAALAGQEKFDAAAGTAGGLKGQAIAALVNAGYSREEAEAKAQELEQKAAVTAGVPGNLKTSGGGIPGITGLANQASGSASSGSATTSAAAAAAAPGIPAPRSGLMADGIHTSTVTNLGNGNYQSVITNTAGETVATQTHNPTLGVSNWTNSQGTFTAQSGTLVGATYIDGPTLAVNSTGSLVDVSAWGLSAFDARGNLKPEIGAVAPRATNEQVAQFQASQAIQGAATGAPQQDLNQGYCFLAGTVISTPDGPRSIETLKPGDKVYSYNEKTRQKQISDFEELDVNFVDEYLIINNQIKTTIYHPFYVLQSKHASSAYSVTPTLPEDVIVPSPSRERVRVRGMNTLNTIRADELKIGDILLNEKGLQIPVYSIEKIAAPDTTVYNLNNVSPNNNFFAENILVHNYSFDTTADGQEDPNPGGEPYNPDGSYTDSWAETGGWNPDFFSPDQISSGSIGGTSGEGGDYSYEGSGKAAAGDAGSGWGDSGNQNTDVSTDPGNQGDQSQSGISAEGGDGGNQGDQGGQSDANSSGADSSGW